MTDLLRKANRLLFLCFGLIAILVAAHPAPVNGQQIAPQAGGEAREAVANAAGNSAANMQTIGVIGGITWVSSIEYYRLMNRLVREKVGGVSSAKVLMYSIEFGEFAKDERLAEQGDWGALRKVMLDAASRLKRGGADFVVIASNTMNSTADLIESEVGIPVLQIADATGQKIRSMGIDKVVLLGTKFTMEAPFYRNRLEQKFGIQVVTPSLADRDYINKVIFDELSTETFTPEAKQRFIEISERLVKETGAKGVILGCTEIPLLIQQRDISVPVFDTTAIHVEAAVNRALSASTLDGRPPLVIAHRGASGYLPEETLEAFQLAIDQGADVIEFDLVSTKDGALIARHDPELSISTDVAERPEFAGRKRVDWLVDGEKQTGWFAHDFTLAEIKTLGAKVTDPERPRQNNGKFRIVTLQDIIDLAKAQSAKAGRSIAIYPETKNPSYHRDLGLPLEDKLIAALAAAGWNTRSAPVFVQSFEPGSLKEMRAKGLQARVVQLIDGDAIDFKTGSITYALPLDRPYDWAKSGDPRLFAAMVTPAGLAEIRTYADGIGPWKPYLVPVQGRLDAAGRLVDVNGDGKVDLRDAATQPATTLVADAHRAGLFVHVFTFRNEKRRLASDYRGDPQAEYLQFFRLGVDGVFSDFPDTAVAARAALLRESQH